VHSWSIQHISTADPPAHLLLPSVPHLLHALLSSVAPAAVQCLPAFCYIQPTNWTENYIKEVPVTLLRPGVDTEGT
jgi:hypothetical protein